MQLCMCVSVLTKKTREYFTKKNVIYKIKIVNYNFWSAYNDCNVNKGTQKPQRHAEILQGHV